MALKLYIWKDVLCDYSCGKIFAIADTEAEARIAVATAAQKRGRWIDDISHRTPEIHEAPFADWVGGGG